MIESLKPEEVFEPELGDKLFQALMSNYSLVRERNDAYVTRAQNLLAFTGIINTILAAFIVAVISKEEVRTFLRSSPTTQYFEFTIEIGFLAYILSILFALAAFRTTRYMPIPQIESKEFINDVFEKKANLSLKHLAMQAYEAICYYDKKNAEKYRLLFWATVFLTLAIISTATLGIIVLNMI